MFAVANKQQFKIKMYKKQIEEAEEIIAFILTKFREAQQELEEANKQQFRKEQDNKEGHEKEQDNFCLKHSLKREGLYNVSAGGIRPFLYWGAFVCHRQMSLFLMGGICLSQAGVSRVACWSKGPLTFFVYHRSDKKSLVISA